MPTKVITSYLEMTSPNELVAKRSARTDVVLAQATPPMPELNRFLYATVGADWYWTDRLPWTYQEWLRYLGDPGVQTWVLSAAGVPAGYFELDARTAGDVEIAYFGLLPAFIGQGLGAHLLTAAVERGWALGPRRVWLHTCTLDHPSALANYQARGFRLCRQETKLRELPPQPPGPWPG